jgi:hypothetical protein
VAVEDRSDDALRRVRAVASGVDRAQAAGPADAVPAILGKPVEEMASTDPERVFQFLPPGGRCEILDTGHFGTSSSRGWCRNSSPTTSGATRDVTFLDHNRIVGAASDPEGEAPPLFLHGLGERAPRPC